MDVHRRDILERFIQDTGARRDSAQDILSRCNWDYQTALQMFTPSRHATSRPASGFAYPPSAQVRHVPIIYVGATNQPQELGRPSSQPVNSTNYGGSAYCPGSSSRSGAASCSSNFTGKPVNLVGGSYAGASARPVHVANQAPHIVTTPTVTRPTPTPQPSAVIQPTRYAPQSTSAVRPNPTPQTNTVIQPTRYTPQNSATVRPTPTAQPEAVLQPARYTSQNNVTARPTPTPQSAEPTRHIPSSNALPSRVQQGYPPGQGRLNNRVDLPVAVEVPITHITADSRPRPISHNPASATGFVTVTPVQGHIVRQAPSPTPLSGGSRVDAPSYDVPTHKAPLVRSNATDAEDGTSRTLKRGISKTSDNLLLVNKARDDVLHDIRESTEDHIQYFVDTPELTFILPDLTIYTEDFRGFLEKDLIETSTLISLEQAGCLNWWAAVGISQRLHPMATTGDGNCLLHAASLAMWGFHDRDLILRKALYHSMTSGAFHGALFRQWRYQQTQVNKQTGLIYSEEEWRTEWENLLRLASTEPRRTQEERSRENSCCDSPLTQGSTNCKHSPVVYESLEELHVFVLAHVLRRPVLVVADKVLRDTNGEALAPIPFGGIYLPLGCKPENCHRTPLLLTYDAAHFSALVPMKKEGSPEEVPSLPVAIPILDCHYDLLPLHFAVDPGEGFDWQSLVDDQVPSRLDLSISQKLDLIERYMNLVKLPFTKLELDNDSDQRSSGSVDSDESVGSGSKEKRKDTKLQQQMHSVSKQFGSLGRSMGKKFKKNFGNIGKSMKNKGPDKNGSGMKNSTIACGVTQNTKMAACIPILFDHEQVVLCAKLSTHRSPMQEQLVKNYLSEAKKRFEADRDLKRQKAVELKSRLPAEKGDKELSKIPVKCVTPGCSMYGTANCSYLCSDCFSRSKKQALEQVGSSTSPFVYNTYPGPRAQMLSGDNIVLECGKSKFYAPVASEEQLELRKPERNFLTPLEGQVPVARPMSAGAAETRSVGAGNMSICRPLASVHRNREVNSSMPSISRAVVRTPSPDCHYDNVEYEDKKVSGHQYCLTEGCTFYGSAAYNNYCSKCFKENQKAPLVQPESAKTQL